MIMDRMDQAGLSWKLYTAGFNIGGLRVVRLPNVRGVPVRTAEEQRRPERPVRARRDGRESPGAVDRDPEYRGVPAQRAFDEVG